jgi:hypothetical protein
MAAHEFDMLETLAEELLIAVYRLPFGARRSKALIEAMIIHEKAVTLRARAAAILSPISSPPAVQ